MNPERFSQETDLNYLQTTSSMLFNRVVELEKENRSLKSQKCNSVQLQMSLAHQLSVLKKKMFGKSSEKRNTARMPSTSKKQEPLFYSKPPVPDPLPEESLDLPVEERIYEDSLEECPNCSSVKYRKMDGQYEESVEVTVTERVYTKVIHKRQKSSCRDCGKIHTADGPVKLMPGCGYSIDMAVQVAIDKYLYHMPLERQRQQMEAAGLKISVKTLWGLTARLAYQFYKLVEEIKSEIKNFEIVHMDESPMVLLKTGEEGYIWSLCNVYGNVFEYQLTRSGKIAVEMLKGYEGNVMTDGFPGYNRLRKVKREDGSQKMTLANCWSHVRRKYDEAISEWPEAEEMLELIGELYKIERQAKDFESLKKLREEKSTEVIDKIKKWLNREQNNQLGSSPPGKIMSYTRKMWPGLIAFLQDPKIPLDNNICERGIRSPVMGRNNFNGFRTIDGADVGMVFYSLVESCKMMRLDPKTYLKEMAMRSAKNQPLDTPYQYALKLRGEES